VTTRSVLIYVEDRRAAFAEFFRVLRLGGRLSIFEPINRFALPHHLFGYDGRRSPTSWRRCFRTVPRPNTRR
jgi:arsenite methyltransferase